jgi:hypothetical protein
MVHWIFFFNKRKYLGSAVSSGQPPNWQVQEPINVSVILVQDSPKQDVGSHVLMVTRRTKLCPWCPRRLPTLCPSWTLSFLLCATSVYRSPLESSSSTISGTPPAPALLHGSSARERRLPTLRRWHLAEKYHLLRKFLHLGVNPYIPKLLVL